ncbi:MAG: SirB2 family protein [Acinetobacter sp.]
METQLLIKIIHMSVVTLACLAIFGRAFTLFKGVQGNMPNPAGRTFFVALQHLSMTLIAATGIALLVMKNFDVQPWFYAKVVLFLVMLSSLSKAYRKTDTVQLQQRRAGLFLAVVSLAAIIGLVIIKPNFG